MAEFEWSRFDRKLLIDLMIEAHGPEEGGRMEGEIWLFFNKYMSSPYRTIMFGEGIPEYIDQFLRKYQYNKTGGSQFLHSRDLNVEGYAGQVGRVGHVVNKTWEEYNVPFISFCWDTYGNGPWCLVVPAGLMGDLLVKRLNDLRDDLQRQINEGEAAYIDPPPGWEGDVERWGYERRTDTPAE